jgi:penicillin-binding protein 2
LRRSDFDPVSIEDLNKQLKKVTLVVLMVFSILVLKLWFLQIFNGSVYRLKSENNRIRLRDVAPFRGTIVDRNGEVLVDNRPAFDLYVIPEEIKDQGQLLEKLVGMVALDIVSARQTLDKASKSNPFRPICLKKDMTRDEVAVIETNMFNLPGSMINVTPKRHYVYGDFASHLLGYLGEINEKQIKSGNYPGNKLGDLIGKSGVEKKWNSELTGIRGGEQVEVDATGRKIRLISQIPPVPGATVALTIDRKLQQLSQNLLLGQSGAIVALNPNNGELLALASSPTFDPNLFVTGMDRKTWDAISFSNDFPLQNRALCGQYPPASVFKIIVALAGLSEEVIDPKEKIVCTGAVTLGRRKFHCWKKYGHGEVDLHQALVQSCDVYFYEMGKRLGVDRIASYARVFGLGVCAGLDVGQERPGLIPTSKWKLRRYGVPWQQGETFTIAIGQGFLLATPIQMATVISSIFNGGIIHRPHVTKRVTLVGGEDIYKFTTKPGRKIDFKSEDIEIVKKALVGVVHDPRGTAHGAALQNIVVAGKTGTAQVVSIGKKERAGGKKGMLQKHKDHAWFVGVAPADRPAIAFAILIEHGGHGGSAAAPIARELVNLYLRNYP